MKKYLLASALAFAVAVASTGCVGFEHHETSAASPTSPSGTSVNGLLGTWTSASTGIIPSPSSCTNFHWTPSQMTPNSAQGAFSATCAGGLNVSGTAHGSLSGTTITWSANATASTPEISSCAISLTGTGELSADTIRVPYSGNTCLGPVSGVEVLQRH